MQSDATVFKTPDHALGFPIHNGTWYLRRESSYRECKHYSVCEKAKVSMGLSFTGGMVMAMWGEATQAHDVELRVYCVSVEVQGQGYTVL